MKIRLKKPVLNNFKAWNTTSNRRGFDVDIRSIRRRPNFDEFPCHFAYLFDIISISRKIHVVSTYFFRRNFAGQKIHVISSYFFLCNFDGPKIHVVSTYSFRCNFDGRKIHVVSTYFFGVISLVENSALFPRTFFDWSKNPRRFHVLFST